MRTGQSEKFGQRLIGSLEKGTSEGARKAWEARRGKAASPVVPVADRPPLQPGFEYAESVPRDSIAAGDAVQLSDPSGRTAYSGLQGGKVLRAGSVNVTIGVPTPKWRVDQGENATTEYKVPRDHVAFVARGNKVHPIHDATPAAPVPPPAPELKPIPNIGGHLDGKRIHFSEGEYAGMTGVVYGSVPKRYEKSPSVYRVQIEGFPKPGGWSGDITVDEHHLRRFARLAGEKPKD